MSGIERAYQVDAECRYPYLRQVPVEGEGAKLDELPFGETIATPAGGFVVDTKRRDEEDMDVVRARSHYDHKLVSADLGYFWDSIVA